MGGFLRRGWACLALVAGLGIEGCVERTLSMDSEPEGAVVYLNDQEVGRTPLQRDFTFYGNYELEVRKDGYQTLKSTQNIPEPWWQLIPMDLFSEMSPFWYRDDRHFTYDLKPATTEPVNPTEMLARAASLRALLLSSPNTRAPTSAPTTAPAEEKRPRTRPPA